VNEPSQQGGALRGKGVIITGAGAGLGRAYAVHAAKSGATVGINDIDAGRADDAAQALRADGLAAIALAGDMSDWESARSVVTTFVAEHGRLDGLVSNAGVFYERLAWEDDGDSVERLITTNVLGAFFGGVHAMQVMIPQGFGSIVNVVSGAQIGLRRAAAYGASKGAVASMTYAWALDLEGTGVRVNGVSPLARTGMGSNRVVTRPSSRPPLPPPEHVAPLVTYMLSDRSRDLMGQIVRLEGPHLTIMCHPSIPEMHVSREQWSVEDIADAIDGPLRGELRHVGRD
jgi:NAD(P)-dependent dehydrogenase (short-subunit alcohol dehydrogenase family)